MNEPGTVGLLERFQEYFVAALAGIGGVYGGVKVHGSKIEDLRERLQRVERKQDRMMEHFAIKGLEGEE